MIDKYNVEELDLLEIINCIEEERKYFSRLEKLKLHRAMKATTISNRKILDNDENGLDCY